MSDSPIYDENIEKHDTPVFNKIEKPETELGPLTGETPTQGKSRWQKILNPTFRRWAYGVTAAAVVAGATWAGKPEFIPVAAPLVMALFYVDSNGTPKG